MSCTWDEQVCYGLLRAKRWSPVPYVPAYGNGLWGCDSGAWVAIIFWLCLDDAFDFIKRDMTLDLLFLHTIFCHFIGPQISSNVTVGRHDWSTALCTVELRDWREAVRGLVSLFLEFYIAWIAERASVKITTFSVVLTTFSATVLAAVKRASISAW